MKTGSALSGFMLRRSIVTCISVSLPLFVAAAAYGQKPPKVGMVNFQEVALQSKVGKAAKARLEKLADQMQKEVKAEEDKFLKRQKDFENKASKLAPAERQNQMDALERESVAIKRLIQDKTEKFRKEEADSVAELSRQIAPIIKAFAAEKGYTMILEARRPGLLYYDKNLDVTAEIVKRFDQTSK
jgi:Skp family chaperone for outer membrane proteins